MKGLSINNMENIVQTNQILENANKLTYLVKSYPDETAENIIKLVQLPQVDVNAAIWLAQELKFLKAKLVDERMVVGKIPETWQFGKAETQIEDTLTYCFRRLAKDETDLDEKFLTDWLAGYPTHDTLVAVKHLVEDRVIAEYKLFDPAINESGEPMIDKDKKPVLNEYLFYTLFENSEMQWGKKNFRKAPKSEGEK